MLKRSTFLFFFMLAMSNGFAQLNAVERVLNSSNPEAIADFFDSTVELTLPGLEDILPRKTALAKLTAFLQKENVTGFNRVHGGSSRGSSGAYLIGVLKSTGGDYRVYAYGQDGQKPVVQELRIEPQ